MNSNAETPAHCKSAKRYRAFLDDNGTIQQTVFPLVYPYPETIQFFKPYTSNKKGSSVFFICSKKTGKA